jgi:hypothetical protein
VPAGGALLTRPLPQSSQNADDGAFPAPHFGQRRESGLPHAAQNRRPLVLSAPHFEQCIAYPWRTFALLYHSKSNDDQSHNARAEE